MNPMQNFQLQTHHLVKGFLNKYDKITEVPFYQNLKINEAKC